MAKSSRQILEIEEPMNNNCVSKKKEQEESIEECSVPLKNKNILNRVVKNVGKVFPQKWNKKKVKCSSL